jgi:hypothetical protein
VAEVRVGAPGGDTGVAELRVGAPGTDTGITVRELLAGPDPTKLIALTITMYDLPPTSGAFSESTLIVLEVLVVANER